MTYDDLVATLQTFLEVPLNQTDENFQRVLPFILSSANDRIYRDLDFLPGTTSQTAALTANVRIQTLPASVLFPRSINVITPFGALPDDVGARRNPLERISPESQDMWFPVASATAGVPTKYSIIGAAAGTPPLSVRLWPEPSLAYNAEYIGVIRPLPPSPTLQTTYVLNTYADLFFAACMVIASGYQRDFSAMSDDPQKAQSWEAYYSTLRTSVMVEAGRMKGEGAQWTTMPPAPVATMPRDRAPGGR